MFITQNKLNNMKDRIINLEGQVEALTTQGIEERDKKVRQLGNLDEKIVYLEKDRQKLLNDIEDIKSKKARSLEEIEHKVKIVMEKNALELDVKKNALILEKDKEVAKVVSDYRNKRELQLEEQSKEMKGMYSEVLKHLTGVSGTLSKPSGVQENGANK